MPADMAALIQRIEAAEVPCRELDAEIAVAVSADPRARVVTDDGQGLFSHQPGWWCDGDNKSHLAPAYTSSLDAAVSLGAAGYWEISGPRRYLNIPTVVPNHWRAALSYFNSSSEPVLGWGATEVLARRSAELRARLAQEPNDAE